ncbi:hypothetical protein LGH70_11145 [Hymenobacter sp. BT635]|uniref:Uncharacterized protein n=1 Tax=Hymenobacter nitidus TaxID=2880929 RepID=A0ABS8ADX0_9BACT|nr:hypothetical protein [Hymenobacter nitidus]MCB2378142.1 hypothetical protein [Hymenobacter nitidus]
MDSSASGKLPASAWFRPLLIGLGWLGFGLFVVNTVVDDWQFETISHSLLRTFDTAKNCLFALWPVAVWVQFETRLKEGWRFYAGILLLLTTIPLWLSCAFLLVFEDDGGWQEEMVQYESVNPPVRIVQQRRNVFPTIDTQYRVVKITPLWGPWQHVEPADTARFPVEHYR